MTDRSDDGFVGAVFCDECGAPATHVETDLLDVTEPADSVRKFKPFGPRKFGCEAHPVETVVWQQAQEGETKP